MTQEENGILRTVWKDLDAMQSATIEEREEIVKSVKDKLEQIAMYIKNKDDEVNKWKTSFETTKIMLDVERQVSKTLVNLIKDIAKGND